MDPVMLPGRVHVALPPSDWCLLHRDRTGCPIRPSPATPVARSGDPGERVTRMHRARRLVFAALLAVMAGLVLTGCRTQPGIASYVGDSRLTDNEVERAVTTIETDVKNAGG